MAVATVLVPQEAPLVWWQPARSAAEILYLEATLSASQIGHVHVRFDSPAGAKAALPIRFGISRTDRALTYHFPLPDVPLAAGEISVSEGTRLQLTSLRIVDGNGVEERRFSPDQFQPLSASSVARPMVGGWELSGTDPHQPARFRIETPSPIAGKTSALRHLLPCVASAGYLGGMIVLILATGHLAFFPARTLLSPRRIATLTLLGVSLAVLGNRALIVTQVRAAAYSAPVLRAQQRLEIDLESTTGSPASLFWQTSPEVPPESPARFTLAEHTGLQTVRFDLPHRHLRALQFSPLTVPGAVWIRGIRIVDQGGRTHAVLPLTGLIAREEVHQLVHDGPALFMRTVPDASRPILEFSPAALAAINSALEL